MSFCTVAAAQPFSRYSDGVVAAYDGSWYEEESKALGVLTNLLIKKWLSRKCQILSK
jgi:hypothetical protein